MKKIIIAAILLFVIIGIGLIGKKYINNLEEKWCEIKIAEYLNENKLLSYMNDKDLIFIEHLKEKDKEEFDISDAITDYIECVKCAVESKITNKDVRKEKYIKNAGLWDVSINGLNNEEIKRIRMLISEDDISSYNNGTLETKLIEQLEQKIEHRSNNINDGWYISNNKDKRVELMFNVYIGFQHSDLKHLKKVKRVLKIDIHKFKDYTKKLNEILEADPFYNYLISKEETNRDEIKKYEDMMSAVAKKTIENMLLDTLDITYEDMSGNVVEKKDIKLEPYSNAHIKNQYSLNNLSDLYVSYTQTAKVTFGQHDYDKEQEEWSRQEEERARQQMEDEANAVVEEEKIDIPQFDKYTTDARLFIRKHITGKLSVRCLLIKRIMANGKPKKIAKDYILPYDDVSTKEEALERYLSDKEHFETDEEWLTEGNIDYNGD